MAFARCWTSEGILREPYPHRVVRRGKCRMPDDAVGAMPSQRQRTMVGYFTLAAVAAFIAQAFLVPQMAAAASPADVDPLQRPDRRCRDPARVAAMAVELCACARQPPGDVACLRPAYRDRPDRARCDLAAQHAFWLCAQHGCISLASSSAWRPAPSWSAPALRKVEMAAPDRRRQPHPAHMRRLRPCAGARLHGTVVLT